MSDDAKTTDPAADGAQKIGFGDIWNECDDQRRRYGIWRDHFAAEAVAALAETPPRSDYARRCRQLSADRARLVETYDTMARLIERVRDDAEILDRLRIIASAEARRAEFEKVGAGGDEVAADD